MSNDPTNNNNNDEKMPSLSPMLQPMNLNETKSYSILTNHPQFRKLVSWAFQICDTEKNGTIHLQELYAGTLLVHLHLAKYAGIAACYPPTYEVIEQLFHAADDDKSGTIDEEEFVQIVVICCGQIMSRIIVYYTFIIILVPILADQTIRIFMMLSFDEYLVKHNPLERILSVTAIMQKIVSFLMFLFLVPNLFDFIDYYSKQSAQLTAKSAASHNASSSDSNKKQEW